MKVFYHKKFHFSLNIDNQTLMKLGEKIKACASVAGYSQEYMAAYFGVSITTLNRLYKASESTTDIVLKASKLFNMPVNYFMDESISENPFNNYNQKPLDGGKFGNDVEEELRAQIEMLKSQLAETNRNNEFLREMMRSTLQQLNISMAQLTDSLGKEYGDEAKRLLLFPGDDKPNEIKMRA